VEMLLVHSEEFPSVFGAGFFFFFFFPVFSLLQLCDIQNLPNFFKEEESVEFTLKIHIYPKISQIFHLKISTWTLQHDMACPMMGKYKDHLHPTNANTPFH
jgi:hypothetical protein